MAKRNIMTPIPSCLYLGTDKMLSRRLLFNDTGLGLGFCLLEALCYMPTDFLAPFPVGQRGVWSSTRAERGAFLIPVLLEHDKSLMPLDPQKERVYIMFSKSASLSHNRTPPRPQAHIKYPRKISASCYQSLKITSLKGRISQEQEMCSVG